MTKTTLITCDVCKKEITDNAMTFSFKDDSENRSHDICEKCFTTQTVPKIIGFLLANRNPPYHSWSITFEGSGWKFEKEAKA